MPNLGAAEIIAILVVALVVLGPQRLPEVGRKIGGFVRQLRTHSDSVKAELRDVIDIDGVAEGVNSVRRDLKDAVSLGPVFTETGAATPRKNAETPATAGDDAASAVPANGAAERADPMVRALTRGGASPAKGPEPSTASGPTRRLPGVSTPAGGGTPPADSTGGDVTRRLPAGRDES
ncbi:MAG: twin-arginine translocase TatA/TatE family subunit [Acidimicrobiia bacterium]|nr:twin-arginine translocase TatA/TatE family subunit [Acidimicrobiia bacterium]